ncbi:MAG: methyl-accepting chemotaxis protein [Christensenellales bacterium]
MKISTKILLFVSALAVVAVTAAVSIVMIENNSYIDETNLKHAQSGLADLQAGIEERLEITRHDALLLAGSAAVIEGVQNDDFTVLQNALDAFNDELKLDTISVTDSAGNVIIRQHQPDKKGDNISDQSNVTAALNGNMQTVIEAGQLVQLSCRSGAPVLGENGQVIGSVVVGYTFENQRLVDELKAVHDMEFTIFQGNTRLATTLTEDGVRTTGTELDPKIADLVLTQGQSYNGLTSIFGMPHYTAYAPLRDMEGDIVGALFAGQSAQSAQATKDAALLYVLIFAPVLIIVLLALLLIFVQKNIRKPLESITAAARKLADGDTHVDVSTKGRDEIAQMARAFGEVAGSVENLAQDIQRVNETLEIGRFDARAQEESYHGAYLGIAKGINETIGRFVAYMDSLPLPILTLDSSYTVSYMNKVGAGLAGKEPSELVGMKCYDIFKTSDCGTDQCACRRAMANQRVETSETDAHPAPGLDLMIQYTGIPIVQNGEVVGAFEVIVDQTAVKKAGEEAKVQAEALSVLLSKIDVAAEQVAAGTRQVSEGSQQIAMGATEQSSAIEQLTSTVSEIAAQTRQNAVSANQASEVTLKVRQEAEEGSNQMDAMQQAMDEINEASENISKIIKVIDDIAFQTNILALNAAVEAARAGAHGKGFAVVAQEVRNLAGRSATAAKETTELIERSIGKAEAGTKIADSMAAALKTMVDGVAQAAKLAAEIAAASGEQASAIGQVDRGIEQMAQVVQMNSATSEETAAASEELSSQAEYLKTLAGQFENGSETEPKTPAVMDLPLELSASDADFGKY